MRVTKLIVLLETLKGALTQYKYQVLEYSLTHSLTSAPLTPAVAKLLFNEYPYPVMMSVIGSVNQS